MPLAAIGLFSPLYISPDGWEGEGGHGTPRDAAGGVWAGRGPRDRCRWVCGGQTHHPTAEPWPAEATGSMRSDGNTAADTMLLQLPSPRKAGFYGLLVIGN